MKVIDKSQIVKSKMVRNVMNERKILSDLDYPLIVNLRYSLQNELDLFMIVDLMLGGDLRYHMKYDKKISMERIKFYVAQTALSINYLHEKGYVHRDIKPDNLLLDAEGNCHLTDFNLSTKVTENGLNQFAGTKPYMAPEIFKKEPYFDSIDWWSLGILTYELCFRKLPFRGDNLQHSVINEEVRFPDGTSSALKSFIKGLLNKNPKKRFNFEKIKKHKWMKGMDWEGLERKTCETPWKPDTDKANCDGIYDLDDQFELKKKRHPLPPEKEAKFEKWNWNYENKDYDLSTSSDYDITTTDTSSSSSSIKELSDESVDDDSSSS